MLISIGLLFITGLIGAKIFQKLKLPSLMGMIIAGMVMGPYGLDLLNIKLLDISMELRELALIIILIRAGLSLSTDDLQRVGRPAAFMSFVPASFEMLGIVVLAPILLGLSVIESALLGTILAAASPAVIIPSMLNIMDEEYGTKKSIPQLVLAGASLDDVYAIVVFTSILTVATGGQFNPQSLLEVPISIVTGILLGIILGFVSLFLFKFIEYDAERSIVLLSVALTAKEIESLLSPYFPVASLLSVMAMAFIVAKYEKTKEIEEKFSDLWTGAQIVLFFLLGASVNLQSAKGAGITAIVLIIGALLFRAVGVMLSLTSTNLTLKEKIFTVVAYTPKATVQAAIGGIPLAMGLESGELILTVSVVAILFTAPLGSIGIEKTYKKLLEKN